jgi:TonB family protein
VVRLALAAGGPRKTAAALGALLTVACPGVALSQVDAGADARADAVGDSGPGATDTRVLTPPVALDMPSIAPPPDAPPIVTPIEVGVVLTINERGVVTDVQVVSPGGQPFDRAVVEGAKRFRFHPAMQGGTPIAVRIPFTQRFEPPPPPPVLTPAQPELDALIEGIVVARGTRKAVSGAMVVATEPDTAKKYIAITDLDGIFQLPVPSGKDLQVRVSAPEHERFLQTERLEKNQSLKIKYLIDRKSYGQYEAYVRAETDRTEVSRTTLSGPELTRVPGTFGDPFRVINLLPGVTSAMGLLPLPIVRGSSPGATGILLDGVRMPMLFHLLWGPSVIHPEFIDHVDFYPGGFPVTYGGYTGGILDGVTRAARPDERRVDIDLNLLQAGGFVREPIPAVGATATVAGRIGYPGILLSLLAPDVSLSYWDYQARLDGGHGRHHWTLFAYGAEDVLQRRPAPGAPFQTVLSLLFHRIDLRYEHGNLLSGELVRVVFGYDDTTLGTGTDSQVTGGSSLGNGTWSVNPQLRVHRTLTPWFELTLGAESYDHTVKNPAPPIVAGSPIANNVSMFFNPDGFYSATGALAQGVFRIGDRLKVIPGARGDVYDERQTSSSITQWSFDPRLLARYKLTGPEHRSIYLKGVVGRYHQPPRLFLPIPGLDVSSLQLGLLASTQYSVGAEATLAKTIELDVNTYYNSMDPVLFDLNVNPSAADVQQPQPSFPAWKIPDVLTPEQNRTLSGLYAKRSGRSYGLEVLIRRRQEERLFGWIAYTLSRSERQYTDGWRLFDFDRLHIFNFVAGLRLPRNWEFGTRILYQSGTPLTTIFGSNATRSADQFRVDLRLDKRAVWNRWLLDFYVDIVNTTVAAESGGLVGASSIRYVLPTIGLRGTL